MKGGRVDRSLFTYNLWIARGKQRKIDYELAIGDLDQASRLPLRGLHGISQTRPEGSRQIRIP